jgi:hypothetical protein
MTLMLQKSISITQSRKIHYNLLICKRYRRWHEERVSCSCRLSLMPSRMSLRTQLTPQVRLTGCCFACVCVWCSRAVSMRIERKILKLTLAQLHKTHCFTDGSQGMSRIKCKPQDLASLDGASVLPASKSPRQKPFIAHCGKAQPLPMLPISISNRKTSLPGNTQKQYGSHFHWNRAQEEYKESEVPIPMRRYSNRCD